MGVAVSRDFPADLLDVDAVDDMSTQGSSEPSPEMPPTAICRGRKARGVTVVGETQFASIASVAEDLKSLPIGPAVAGALREQG